MNVQTAAPASGAVDEVVTAIGNSFSLSGGRPRLDEDALAAHATTIVGLPSDRRERVAIELVALAGRVVKTNQDAWDDALVQLCLLVSVALNDVGRADALMTDSLGEAKARAIIAAVDAWKPVGADGKQPGTVSPIGALLASRMRTKQQDR